MIQRQESLIGLSKSQLNKVLIQQGVPQKQLALRTKQIFNAIYVRGVREIRQITGIGKELQSLLSHQYHLKRPQIICEKVSVDGTRKWVLRLEQTDPTNPNPNPVDVETVYIPEPGRGTLCVSSQVGCSLNCSFCYTGTQKMMKNLSPGEILAQVMVARDQLDDYANAPSIIEESKNVGQSPHSPALPLTLPSSGRNVSNIVMMGMGEPLLNFENVKQALQIALDDDGLGFSRRRLTLSTSGVVPGIHRTGQQLKVALAISLHAVRDELRNVLVPINRKYPLAQLLNACQQYPGLSNARRITFEYVMLKGINDSIADARELVRLLADIPSKINLIPFNPWPGTQYQCSEPEVIAQFAELLHHNGYSSPVRATRGQDIMAACGQLKSVLEPQSVDLG